MKHLLLLIFASVVAYAAWVLSDKDARKIAMREITQHGIRIGFIVAVILLMVAAAANLPSTSLI